MDKKYNFDWLVEELEIQLSVLDMAGEKRKVHDIIRAIEILKKDLKVFYFPAVMNFISIQRMPPPSPPPVFANPTTQASTAFFGNTSGNTPGLPNCVPVVPASIPIVTPPVYGYPIAPCPTPISISPYPSYFNNEPKAGDRIFGLFNDECGIMRFCIYTWQEEDNPEEIHSYSVGSNEFYPAGKKYSPCKKYQHEKFLVICTNECCSQ